MKYLVALILAILVVLSTVLIAHADTTESNMFTFICEWMDESHTSSIEELLGE